MKYGVIKNLISEDLRHQMVDLMDLLKDHSQHIDNNHEVLGGVITPSFTCIFNSIQLHILPEMEKIFNVELVPTSNFSRIYQDGSVLLSHLDREIGEYGITINLYQEKDSWPIWMEYDNNRSEIKLNPGDGAWYKGCEVKHWREVNNQGIGYQTFMHYVDKNGEYSDHIYDKNPKRWFNRLNNPMFQFDF